MTGSVRVQGQGVTIAVVVPARGWSFPSISSNLTDFSRTCAIDGGRPRWRFAEYALVAAKVDDKDAAEIRREARDALPLRLPSSCVNSEEAPPLEAAEPDSGIAESGKTGLGCGGGKDEVEEVADEFIE